VRLQARDDPHGEVALAGQCANGGGHGAGGDAGDLAESTKGTFSILFGTLIADCSGRNS
jgi:hypothetical protein